MPFNVALVAPEIPQNTGNIIRLCANTGSRLHLVEPLGFSLTDKQLRRASLDYSHLADVVVHDSVESLFKSVDPERVFVTTTEGKTSYDKIEYQPDDTVVFGSESRGLPDDIISTFHPDRCIRIPMMPSNRSINLSNAVALVVYEMWRQHAFVGEDAKTLDQQQYFS
ncbi:MAG: tRNA (cytidine(34)-2'-O)-methyltransferase [Chloroflexi bacterium]|nr:tRNA (cytidine(34)-2'-O)-methyltransferase [Chloroflexota bacterium]